jgi:hypothetical protein
MASAMSHVSVPIRDQADTQRADRGEKVYLFHVMTVRFHDYNMCTGNMLQIFRLLHITTT